MYVISQMIAPGLPSDQAQALSATTSTQSFSLSGVVKMFVVSHLWSNQSNLILSPLTLTALITLSTDK